MFGSKAFQKKKGALPQQKQDEQDKQISDEDSVDPNELNNIMKQLKEQQEQEEKQQLENQQAEQLKIQEDLRQENQSNKKKKRQKPAWMDSEDEFDSNASSSGEEAEKEENIDYDEDLNKEIDQQLAVEDQDSRTICVSNLDFYLKPEQVVQFFQQYGKVVDYDIPSIDGTNLIKGKAFLIFQLIAQAQKAQRLADGEMFSGRKIRVTIGLDSAVQENVTKKYDSKSEQHNKKFGFKKFKGPTFRSDNAAEQWQGGRRSRSRSNERKNQNKRY